MKEFPILYNALMVQAWFTGHKKQTRRLAWGKNGKPTIWQNVKPGDVLWGRENWNITFNHETIPGEYVKSPIACADDNGGYGCACGHGVVYQTDSGRTANEHSQYGKMRWKPSIHMPRWACRILQPVTVVRIERLQEITEVDAISEGSMLLPNWPGYEEEKLLANLLGERPPLGDSPRKRFIRLWKELYGPDSWDANPEVVVISYEAYQARRK